MIRVFYENGCGVEFENNLKEQINADTCNGNIVKIEKQVKELTLEECNKLYLVPNTKFLNSVDKSIAISSVSNEDFGCLQLDEYIDITDLIKEK